MINKGNEKDISNPSIEGLTSEAAMDGNEGTEPAQEHPVYQNDAGVTYRHYTPTDDLRETWKKWKQRREADRVLTIREAAAITFGIKPNAVPELTDETEPSKKMFRIREKHLIREVDDGRNLQVVPGKLVTDKEPYEENIRFSQLMDYVIQNRLWVCKELADIENAIRKKEKSEIELSAETSTCDITAQKSASVPFKESAHATKVRNLERTFAAVLLLIAYFGKERETIPRSVLHGGKLNQSALEKQIQTLLQKEEIVAHMHDYEIKEEVRRHIGNALKHLPASIHSAFFAAAKEVFPKDDMK